VDRRTRGSTSWLFLACISPIPSSIWEKGNVVFHMSRRTCRSCLSRWSSSSSCVHSSFTLYSPYGSVNTSLRHTRVPHRLIQATRRQRLVCHVHVHIKTLHWRHLQGLTTCFVPGSRELHSYVFCECVGARAALCRPNDVSWWNS